MGIAVKKNLLNEKRKFQENSFKREHSRRLNSSTAPGALF